MSEIAPLVRRPIAVDPNETYLEIGIRSFGKGVFHKPPTTGLQIGSKRVFSIEPSDLLFNIVFAWEGAVAVASAAEKGAIGSHRFLTCVANRDLADPKYLYWWFSHAQGRDQLLRASPGGAGRNRTLGIEKLAAIEVPLPPLVEQRRVVSHIEKLIRDIEEAKQLRDGASKEAAALVAAIRRQNLDLVPSNDWVPLKNFVSVIENGKSPATEGRPAERDEWAVLKVGAVSYGQFDADENKALPPTFKPLPEFEVRVGDFLMGRANSPELVGACAVVRATRPKLMLSDKIFRFVFKDGAEIDLSFLDHVLKSPALRSQIAKVATGTSPSMKNISKGKVLDLRVPRLPLPQQQLMARQLDAIQASIEKAKVLQTETVAELSALVPAILDRAFKGEL